MERQVEGLWVEEKRLTDQAFGLMPCMLGSVICHLHRRSDQERLEIGECSKDPLGYSVMKGAERLVIIQEKLREKLQFFFSIIRRRRTTKKPKTKATEKVGKLK